MKSSEIRDLFLEYFEEREHRLVPSSSLVPNDPTLLLTNAGMVQFKPYFLGEEKPSYTRAASVQKCLRTTDIDSVGLTARHNTFFEMLGNFSFGDYYKGEAIPWAWELVTGRLGLDPSTLWISVYEEDDEAEGIWKGTPGVVPERVIRLGAEDNFWDMGPTGPCGPCSEILYDRGEGYSCGPGCRAGCDCDRFLELWNLVFMQYNRGADGALDPLPKKNIDTGMGLERVAAIKQGVATIFETDLFAPLLESIENISGARLGGGKESDISIKVVADHARASAFLISDGVIPSNEGRGYILRRLLRRAVRHGRLIGIEERFIHRLAGVVVEALGGVYPGLEEHHRLIEGVISAEEERFGQTLEQGMELLRKVIEEHAAGGRETIDGRTAFYLHDTLGFPLELTREIAADSGMEVDGEGFGALMEEQRERARRSRESEAEVGGCKFLVELAKERGPTCFEGYSCSGLTTRVAAIVVGTEFTGSVSGDTELEVILESTPFYAESGGQLGDTGVLRGGGGTVTVEDTHYGAPGLVMHRGRLSGELKLGDEVEAEVDLARRGAISRNHSATHILHWALREVLGTHARQSGSLVTPERLRFDFTHFEALEPGELGEIERLANEKVMEDASVATVETSREDAEGRGAVALFGEKYGEEVRVVEIGDFSMELCGGIHVERSGRIGPIKILSESGIGAGLRRLEAVTGRGALEHFRRAEELLEETAAMLKTGKDGVPQRVSEVLERLRELERESARDSAKALGNTAEEMMGKGESLEIAGVKVFLGLAPGQEQKGMRDLADLLQDRGGYGVVALAAASGKKAQLVVKVGREPGEKGLNARELASAGGRALGGGGGGRPDMAMAGGGRVEGLAESLLEVRKAVAGALGVEP